MPLPNVARTLILTNKKVVKVPNQSIRGIAETISGLKSRKNDHNVAAKPCAAP